MMRRLDGRKLIISALVIAAVLFFIIIYTSDTFTEVDNLSVVIDAWKYEDLQEAIGPEFDPPEGSIFFHETAFRQRRADRHLNPRQACAVESAARMNPDTPVYVLFSSQQIYIKDEITKIVLEYPNVHFAWLHLESYAAGTPLNTWLKTGKLRQSSYRTSHTSDVLRFLTLWKYGGVYLDLDVVVAKPLDGLGLNWVGREDEENAGSSVIGFSRNATGRKFTDAALSEIKTNFRGDIWGYNGPQLITRVMKNLCSDHKMPGEKAEDRCQGMRMFPVEYFYPFPYSQWKLYFEPGGMERLSNNTYVYHMWNKLSSDYRTNASVQVPYTYLAATFCPNVYNVSKDNFYSFGH